MEAHNIYVLLTGSPLPVTGHFLPRDHNTYEKSHPDISFCWRHRSSLRSLDGTPLLGSAATFCETQSGTCCSRKAVREHSVKMKSKSGRCLSNPSKTRGPRATTELFPISDDCREAHAGGAKDQSEMLTPADVHTPGPETRSRKTLRVAVVGAGVSGIGACKILSEAGLHVDVFEARDKIGGIWSRTYKTTSLQTPRTAYKFSDWDWPRDTPPNPTHLQVVAYLGSYIRHFQLGPKIHLNSRVTEMRRDGAGWLLQVGDTVPMPRLSPPSCLDSEHGVVWLDWVQWRPYDFCILCSGSFGDVPNLPTLPPGQGPEVFHGRVLHSVDYSGLSGEESRALLEGKRVVVVGFQKTAIDVTLEAAAANSGEGGQACTLLFRKPHWVVPRDLGFLTHLFTRFFELWCPRPNQPLLLTLLQTAFPVRGVVNKMVEWQLRRLYPLHKNDLIPPHSFLDDLSACILPQMPPHFFPLVDRGLIRLLRSPNWKFTQKGVRLGDGREVEADVVVMCTGYDGMAKLRSLLPPEYAHQLCLNGQSMYLYRGMVHPRVPDVAFLGFHEGLSSMHSAEMGSRWVAHLLMGAFQLPPQEVMEKDCREWWALKQSVTPYAARISCIAPIQSYHFDHLCRDMGWAVMRKKNMWEHWFGVYGSTDYAPMEGEGVHGCGDEALQVMKLE